MLALVLVLLSALILLTGCNGAETNEITPTGEEYFIVGFVYVSPIGGAGWTFIHDQGRQYLEANIPGVRTIYFESIPEGPDAERVMTELVQRGAGVIFGTSFGYMDPMLNVAARFPEVVFMHCSGHQTADNLGTYFGKIYQARFLSGIAAGLRTETNRIGYVAAFPIPEVVRGINAFTLGVRSVNPDATVTVVWTNTWSDPSIEHSAAIGLIDMGVDVVTQHQDTPAVMQAAEERGVWGISYHSDMTAFAPNAVMTGPVWNWGPFYVEVVRSVMDGTWTSGQYWGPMADGIVGLAPFNENVMTTEMIGAVEIAKAKVIAGELDIFAGPIIDQGGQMRVLEGNTMTDEERLRFDWFVEGVISNL